MKDIFNGKTILITGGTGYLGIALVKEILKYDPKAIRVYSRDEVKHYRFLEHFNHDDRLRCLIGDVRDSERIRRAAAGCDLVIHAAALKRLDILEYNVDESIKTNVTGTLNIVNACIANKVEKAVYISTDKACSPVNTYGACKFVGERIFIESNYSKGGTYPIFSVVRYGNVLESTGSVIPFFEEKIKAGEDIPLTDKRMTRFIITPEEAVNLVFKAFIYGAGGDVFIPKLPSFRIIDLIKILNKKHKTDNHIEIIGIRPGEKIHEIMINQSEVSRTYSFDDLYVIGSHIEKPEYYAQLPVYVRKGRLLSEDEMTEYSSKDSLLSRDEIMEKFRKLCLI